MTNYPVFMNNDSGLGLVDFNYESMPVGYMDDEYTLIGHITYRGDQPISIKSSTINHLGILSELFDGVLSQYDTSVRNDEWVQNELPVMIDAMAHRFANENIFLVGIPDDRLSEIRYWVATRNGTSLSHCDAIAEFFDFRERIFNNTFVGWYEARISKTPSRPVTPSSILTAIKKPRVRTTNYILTLGSRSDMMLFKLTYGDLIR